MKSIKLLIFSSLLLFQFSCSTEPENDYITYKIHVDNIEHPDTISVNDTLAIKFYGFVGSNGCHGFSHFEEHKGPQELEITVWGAKPDFEKVCPAVLVYLEGKEYNTLLSKRGLLQIKVVQPDNSFLVDTIYVE